MTPSLLGAPPAAWRLGALLVFATPPASAWITVSQSEYGTSIARIRNESVGLNVGNPLQSLGHLWSLPQDPMSTTGLGSSITWAWDSAICDEVLRDVKENVWFVSLVSCESLRASMNRAFDTWAMNSRFIKFTDVTSKCAADGYAVMECPHAEIKVTALGGVRNATHSEPALSTRRTFYSTTFRSTAGERPYRAFSSGSHTFHVYRQVPETVGGTIAFRTEDTCWFLDSQFCSGFNDWKRAWSSGSAYSTFVILLLLVWGASVFLMSKQFAARFKRLFMAKFKALEAERQDDPHDEIQDEVSYVSVAKALLSSLAHFSLIGLALRLTLLMLVWPYIEAASSCFHCYDFEAAAAHQVGHLLGLGHPDVPPAESTMTGFTADGRVSYHAGLAAGEALNASTCANVWADVQEGLPPGAHTEREAADGYRRSIMTKFTLDDMSSCLYADDLEALNVLYPDCNGGPTVPLCAKPALNLGWQRILLFICVPLGVAFGTIACLQVAAGRATDKLRRMDLAKVLRDAEREKAAAKIQALRRGQVGRRQVTDRKKAAERQRRMQAQASRRKMESQSRMGSQNKLR